MPAVISVTASTSIPGPGLGSAPGGDVAVTGTNMATRIGVAVTIPIPRPGLGSVVPTIAVVGVSVLVSISLPGPGPNPVVPTGVRVGSGGRLKARNVAVLEAEVIEASVLKLVDCIVVAILIPGPGPGPVVRGGVGGGIGCRTKSWIAWP
jgi:hypothetical protein